MPFIPHTDADIRAMLAVIGIQDIDQLFDEIPAPLHGAQLAAVPEALTEMEIGRLMQERAETDGRYLCFIGAGAYEHHIPAAVWQVATRGEFYSAYTPYQAEASQGTLQLLYEYQTMMASLTGMDVSNASLYDGASALAEAVLMAIRLHRKGRKVLVPRSVHPAYRKVARTIVHNQGIELIEPDYDMKSGSSPLNALERHYSEDCAALVISQPNFFGVLEDVDALTDWAHGHGLLVIACVNPTSLALLKAPGEWGSAGADIVVGEGQPLGVPLSSGGPYFGFMATRQEYVRQMPGRIIGRTVDRDGRPGFTLTLQAREQHIRRSKATSNICTNQGLLVTAATIYMSLLGPEGLERVAAQSHANVIALLARLGSVAGVEPVFDHPVFHEVVLRLNSPVGDVLRAMEAQGILAGFALTDDYPELGQCLLVCATETKTTADIDRYTEQMQRILSKRRLDPPCAQKM